MLISTLQYLAAFQLGIGFIFFVVDLRTRFNPLYRHFCVCLLVMPSMSLLDLFSYASSTPPEARLILQRILHLVVLPYIPLSIAFLRKLAGARRGIPTEIFVLLTALLAPLCFLDVFLALRDGAVRGGPVYAWTFLPLGGFYVLYAYVLMIRHLAVTPRGQRKFPALHLLGFSLASTGGVMDMLGVVDRRLFLFCSCKSIGILIFGGFCAYFFASHFLRMLRERSELFDRVEGLSKELGDGAPARKIGESAAIISHEIKNYAAVLKLNQLLLRNKMGAETSPAELDRIGRSAERIESFARSVVDYSGSGKGSLSDLVDVPRVMEECARAHFPGPWLIRIRHSPIEARIPGDASRLERVFINLWKNSLEAKATRIECQVSVQRGRILIAIEDDGEGCPDRDLDRIGTAFFTTKRSSGGAGLGTAITRSILQSHGGGIRFAQAGQLIPGSRGLRVELDLPACEPDEPVREIRLKNSA
jgi:signal transduction histidine kinase